MASNHPQPLDSKDSFLIAECSAHWATWQPRKQERNIETETNLGHNKRRDEQRHLLAKWGKDTKTRAGQGLILTLSRSQKHRKGLTISPVSVSNNPCITHFPFQTTLTLSPAQAKYNIAGVHHFLYTQLSHLTVTQSQRLMCAICEWVMVMSTFLRGNGESVSHCLCLRFFVEVVGCWGNSSYVCSSLPAAQCTQSSSGLRSFHQEVGIWFGNWL